MKDNSTGMPELRRSVATVCRAIGYLENASFPNRKDVADNAIAEMTKIDEAIIRADLPAASRQPEVVTVEELIELADKWYLDLTECDRMLNIIKDNYPNGIRIVSKKEGE